MILEDLKYKAECFYASRSLKHVLRILPTDGTVATVLYRAARWLHGAGFGMGIAGWIVSEINKILHGCVIGRGVEFGKGFVLMHPIGVVINSAVRGGERVVIESDVVIGAARNGFPVLAPSLGNDIFIGSGAKILGGIRIGNHVTIGANAVVIKDVDDGLTVAGVPARVVGQRPDVTGP